MTQTVSGRVGAWVVAARVTSVIDAAAIAVFLLWSIVTGQNYPLLPRVVAIVAVAVSFVPAFRLFVLDRKKFFRLETTWTRLVTVVVLVIAIVAIQHRVSLYAAWSVVVVCAGSFLMDGIVVARDKVKSAGQ